MLPRLFLFISCLLQALLFSCRQPAPEPRSQGQKDSIADSYYAYQPRYELKDTLHNGNLQSVLRFWKAYESGRLQGLEDLFSDTVTMIIEAQLFTGPASVALDRYAAERARLRFTQCHIDFWKVQHIVEKGENWVFIWVQREGTLYNGSLDSKAVHQVWRFRNGRAYSLQEFRSVFYW